MGHRQQGTSFISFLVATLIILGKVHSFRFGNPLFNSAKNGPITKRNMVYASAATERVINLSESAAKQISGLQKERGWVHVKVGVRNAGCSGMSYVFEPCKIEDINAEDIIYEDFIDNDIRCVIDREALPYIEGLLVDFSNELVGGGFAFRNPNAETTCSCGNSFNLEKVKSLCEDRTDEEQAAHEKDQGR